MLRPLRIVRVLEQPPRTACRPVRVKTDEGTLWLKPMRHGVAPRLLAAEWVGTRLGSLAGAPVAEPLLVELTEDDAEIIGEGVVAGPAVALSDVGPHRPWRGAKADLRQAVNIQALADAICLDTWVWNEDRFKPNAQEPWRGTAHSQNVLLAPTAEGSPSACRIALIDQSAAFAEDILRLRLGVVGLPPEAPTVLGCFPELKGIVTREHIRDALRRTEDILPVDISTAVNQLPHAWGITAQDRNPITAWLVRRRQIVLQHLETWLEPVLWPQPHISFDIDDSVSS